MKKLIQNDVSSSLLIGILLAFLIHIPVLGVLFCIFTTFPLMVVSPSLGATGDDVTIGFAWIILKSPKAWLSFIIYYTFLVYIFKQFRKFLRKRKEQKNG